MPLDNSSSRSSKSSDDSSSSSSKVSEASNGSSTKNETSSKDERSKTSRISNPRAIKHSYLKQPRRSIRVQNSRKSKVPVPNKKVPIEPVLGNMNIDCWKIYEGINYQDKQLKQHSVDLNGLLIERKKYWNGISSSPRKIQVLHTLGCYEDGLMKMYKSIYAAFDHLLVNKAEENPTFG